MKSVAAGAAERPRIEALDGLRGIAILLVVLLHTGGPPPGVVILPTSLDMAFAHVASYGWAGVDLFFVLSGFLITGILSRSKGHPHYFLNFYARRTLRIFPLYYAVIVAGIWLWPQKQYGSVEVWSYLAYWSNFWQAAQPANAPLDMTIGPAWSLAIEEQFYLLWPALVYLCSTRRMLRICLAIVVGAPILRWLLLDMGSEWGGVYRWTHCRVDSLAFGALVALLPRCSRTWWWAVGGIACTGLFMVVVLQGHAGAYGKWMQIVGYTCNSMLAAAAVALALQPGIVAWIGKLRWLQSFGRYSYAIYLFHGALIHWLYGRCFGPDAWLPLGTLIERSNSYLPSVFLFSALVALVSLSVAFVSWHLFENRVLAWRRYFT